MDVDANEEGDDRTWILPYEGAGPLNPPPAASDFESEIEEAAPMSPPPILADHEPEAEAATVGTGRLVPLTGRRLFTNTRVYIGSSSSAAAGHDPKDLALSRIRSDLNALHRSKTSTTTLHYQEAPYVPPITLVVLVDHDDLRDPYVVARDVATVSATDDNGPAAREETSPSEPQGFPPRDSYNANGSGGQGGVPAVRECTFAGFMKCNPAAFHGNKEVVELCRWFEKTEMVFGISECAKERKVATRGLEAANRITWTKMKKLLTEEFCPAEEIQRMEHELWNLKVKTLTCLPTPNAFMSWLYYVRKWSQWNAKKINAYIKGLTDNIKGEVTSSKPTSLNEAVRMAHTLMEQKAHARTERIAEGNKRRWESFQGVNNSNNRNNYRDNTRHHQRNNQRKGNVRAMTTTQNEGAEHGGPPPTCNRYRARYYGCCTIKCHKCGKIEHKERDYRGKAIATGANA
ncbi:hypothetical protein Tco_0516723 [Tanacetum coccineum]